MLSVIGMHTRVWLTRPRKVYLSIGASVLTEVYLSLTWYSLWMLVRVRSLKGLVSVMSDLKNLSSKRQSRSSSPNSSPMAALTTSMRLKESHG